MWRYLVGAVAALLLAGGGMWWWKNTAVAERGHRHVAAMETSASDESGNLADPLPDPPVADEKSREQRRFDRTDKNKDGRISRDEYLALRRKNFAKLDKNGDGVLSFDEYATKAIDKFTAADKDHSGALNAAEFATTKVQRKAKPRAKCPPPERGEGKPDDDGV
jgi:hypothetical protein